MIALSALLIATVLAALPAQAQTPTAAAVQGTTFDGKPFQLSSLKGKVVLVVFWSTECAVCRDKMAELRQNYQIWRTRPFEMVLVSTDRKLQDVEEYEKIISRTVPLKQQFVQLWSGHAGYQDSFGKPPQLPVSFLVDKGGNVVERYSGRIPPEAWSRVGVLAAS
jgi:glutathione peroxidase-family protein